MREHDPGTTAGVVDGPDVGRPNASGDSGMRPADGARETGAPSCRIEALERLAIALDEDRAQDPAADLPFVCDRRDVEALLAEVERLRDDAARLDFIERNTAARCYDGCEIAAVEFERFDECDCPDENCDGDECGVPTQEWRVVGLARAWGYYIGTGQTLRDAVDDAMTTTPTPAAPQPGECPHCDRFREQGKSDEYLAAMHGTDHANKTTPAAPGAVGA